MTTLAFLIGITNEMGECELRSGQKSVKGFLKNFTQLGKAGKAWFANTLFPCTDRSLINSNEISKLSLG